MRIAVVGAGTMGHGIAYVAATAGLETRITDPDPAALARAMDQIAALFDRAVERGKLPPGERAAGLARVGAAASLEAAVRDADAVIEAAPERLEVKRAVFAVKQCHAQDRSRSAHGRDRDGGEHAGECELHTAGQQWRQRDHGLHGDLESSGWRG